MATQSATLPIPITKAGNEIFLPAFTLWLREVVRFYRQRSRVVGVIASPILFWVAIGSGFGTSFRSGANGGQNYLEYFYPGALIMIVLFTSIFTMMSVIEDRKEGFLLSVRDYSVHHSRIDFSGVCAVGGSSHRARRLRPHRSNYLPGLVRSHRARFRHCLAHGFDASVSRHH
jgi:hypothetical protein